MSRSPPYSHDNDIRSSSPLLSDDLSDPQYGRNHRGSRRKRFKVAEEHDRISALPDSLLLHILSFLPVDDAVRTDVLSKRWQFLWTSNPNLVFSHDHCRRLGKRAFLSFVDRALVLCGASDVKRFRVQFDYNEADDSRSLDLWTRFAAKNRVEDLVFDLYDGESLFRDRDFYTLPQLLYSNSWLKSLRLSLCQLVPTGLINWKALKNLSIGYVVLSENLIQNVLVGCPVLEFLELYYFRGVSCLNICSASVRKLVIREYWSSLDPYHRDDPNGGEEDSKFDVSGPNLRSLEISGCLDMKKCRVMNVPSLMEANLSFDLPVYDYDDYDDGSDEDHEDNQTRREERQTLIGELLEGLKHVHTLSLGNWCFQYLRGPEPKGLPFQLSNRKRLELHTSFTRRDFPLVSSFLESSPYLETVVINMGYFREYESSFRDDTNYDEKTYWASQKWTSKCFVQHLRTVTIVEFNEGNDCMLDFLKFVLQKARLLKKISIHAPKATSSSHSSLPRELFRSAGTLLSFPRSSPQAVVVFSGLK